MPFLTTPPRLDRLRTAASVMLGRVASIGMAAGLALIGGIASSYYMIDVGSPLTSRTSGPWTTWPAAGRFDADPYTRAHFARRGGVPVSSALAQTFEAQTDSTGRRLTSFCDYSVEGQDDASVFWTLSVYDDRGRLIPNPAERYAHSSETIARQADGSYAITAARDARSGNWLPTAGAGRIILVFTVLDAVSYDASGSLVRSATPLPAIRRSVCR